MTEKLKQGDLVVVCGDLRNTKTQRYYSINSKMREMENRAYKIDSVGTPSIKLRHHRSGRSYMFHIDNLSKAKPLVKIKAEMFDPELLDV